MTPTPRPESSEELIAEAYHTALENPYIKPLCDRIRSLTTELAALKAQDEVHWKTRRSLIKERDAARAVAEALRAEFEDLICHFQGACDCTHTNFMDTYKARLAPAPAPKGASQ